jgi:hypothetical protein
MNLSVSATVSDKEVYKQLIEGFDIISIMINLHDSNLEDTSEYANFQRDEINHVIKVLTKRRNKRYDEENKV